MKKIVSTVTVCLLFVLSTFSQTYTVRYKTEVRFEQPKGLETNFPTQYREGTLVYKNGESNYTETKLQAGEIQTETEDITSVVMGGNGMVYKNTIENIIFAEEDILGKKLIVSYEKPKCIFGKETQQINGYTCYSAEFDRGRKHFKVWYCPQIPIPDGPSTYAGLPGLIFKVELKHMTISILSIQKESNNIEIQRLHAKNPLSESEVAALRLERVSEFARSMGAKVQVNKP